VGTWYAYPLIDNCKLALCWKLASPVQKESKKEIEKEETEKEKQKSQFTSESQGENFETWPKSM
jgi:hypothetical protein